jgi:phage terminase small subunit
LKGFNPVERFNPSRGKNTGKMSGKQPYWVGNATTENFSVTARQLEEAIELRDEWRREIEMRETSEGVEISPRRADAERNSRASGDHNLLHQDTEVVKDVSEKYDFVRESDLEGDFVVSQGMSFVDALVGELDGPVRSVGGEWEKMVYAAETGETDTVVLSQEDPGEFSAELQPAGTEEVIDAGEVSLEYAEDGGYHPRHNEYMTTLADQAVGRGFEQPEIRNGELLISNELEAYGPIDWNRAEEFVFNLSEVEEGEHQVKADWDIDVDYGEATDEAALSYSETSMYADGFEAIESVKRAERSNPFQAYMDASMASAELTSELSMMPMRVGTAAMKSMTPRSD